MATGPTTLARRFKLGSSLPAHCKALQNCASLLADINFQDIERTLVDQELIEHYYFQSTEELIHDMIHTRCPIEYFTDFVKILKSFPQYCSKAEALEGEWHIQRDQPPVCYPVQVSRPECVEGKSYGPIVNGSTTMSCAAQRASERMALRFSPEMIQKCIDAVQNMCDGFVEICQRQTVHTEAHQCDLDQIILDLENIRAIKDQPTQEQPTKEELTQKQVNSIIRKLNSHLEIISNFVNAAVDKWFSFSQRQFAHSALKFLNNMVQELKDGKSTSGSLANFEERFGEMLKKLDHSAKKDKKIPWYIAAFVAAGGAIITIATTIAFSAFWIPLVGATATAAAACGSYYAASKAIKYCKDEGDRRWRTVVNRKSSAEHVS